MMTRHLVRSRSGRLTVSRDVAQANRQTDRDERAGLRCLACGQYFGDHDSTRRFPRVERSEREGVCRSCALDLD